MSQVIYYAAVSIDGFIATPDGSVAWLEPFESSGEDYGYADFYASIDAIVMGRRTYEQALGFGGWPYPDKPVRVVTSRPLDPVSANVTATSLAPAEIVAQLEATGAQRIWLVGGGAVAGEFARVSAIDEYIVSTMPVLLGAGVPLLGEVARVQRLTLVESRRFADGVIQSVYRRGARA